jgi:hypothetical protein
MASKAAKENWGTHAGAVIQLNVHDDGKTRCSLISNMVIVPP